jgi:hypothetical protein
MRRDFLARRKWVHQRDLGIGAVEISRLRPTWAGPISPDSAWKITRADLFAAAMLGRLDIIKAAAAAFPNILRVPGSHKIPLVAHAEKGGAEAQAVVDSSAHSRAS